MGKCFWPLALCVGAFLFGACQEKVKTKEVYASQGAQQSEDAKSEKTVYTDAYYTAFDGSQDYSLLLLGERENWKVKDSSIAKVEDAEVNISDENFDKLLKPNYDRIKERRDERCAEEPDSRGCDEEFTYESFKERFSSRFRVKKITPLKAGVTELTASRRGRGGDGDGDERTKYLVITEFSASTFEAGKTRYNEEGQGNLKACASCHLSGNAKAPPHALGRIKDYSDDAIMEWVTTGEYSGAKASVNHTWEFLSDEQEKGIVPYLRSLQAKDVNSSTEQYISEINGDFEDGIGGSD